MPPSSARANSTPSSGVVTTRRRAATGSTLTSTVLGREGQHEVELVALGVGHDAVLLARPEPDDLLQRATERLDACRRGVEVGDLDVDADTARGVGDGVDGLEGHERASGAELELQPPRVPLVH